MINMKKLRKLGVECRYDPQSPEKLHYSITVKPNKLQNPYQTRKYFRDIINAIADDAKKKDGLENITLSIENDQYLNILQDVSKGLIDEAKNQKIRTEWENAPTLVKAIIGVGAIGGGIVGLLFGYDQMTEWATNTATYMNNTSHLWAPITGTVQLGISVLGTGITTVIGVVVGAIGGAVISLPYLAIKIPLANKVSAYESLEQALSQSQVKKDG